MPTPRTPTAEPPRLKPLELLLLAALASGERHGYALKKEVVARTDGKLRPGPATLYRALAKLETEAWIAESGRRPSPELDDERRRYFRLTERGRKMLIAELGRLERLTAVVQASLPELEA